MRGISEVASPGMSLLEVGGGIGDIQVALLESGVASTAINVELSSSWEDAATELLTERGLQNRVQRVMGDFVDQAGGLPNVDVVVLHRVVCCYPHWKALLEAAVAKANKVIAVTFPIDRWWTRIGIATANLICRIRRQAFRAYVHRPGPIIDLMRAAGFSVKRDRAGRIWRTVIATRR